MWALGLSAGATIRSVVSSVLANLQRLKAVITRQKAFVLMIYHQLLDRPGLAGQLSSENSNIKPRGSTACRKQHWQPCQISSVTTI
jgi:hypothetical protein